MGEPLTDEELNDWEAYYIRIAPTARTILRVKRMAAEIRGLRDTVAVANNELSVWRGMTNAAVRADNDRLREDLKTYGRHKNRCGWSHFSDCDCGLDDALAEDDDTEDSP